MIIHANWAPHRAVTGRWGCGDPNLQNVPKDMRDLFVPRESTWFLVGADFSALELRLIALLSGDQPLLDCYDKGIDPHWFNAREVLGMTQGLEIERDIAKTVAYAFSYNLSEDASTVWKATVVKLSDKYPGIAQTVTLNRMQTFRARWFKGHPAIRNWQLESVAAAEANKFVEAPLSGRRRYYHDGHVDPNEVLNYPMQATGADLCNRAVLAIDKEIRWDQGEAIVAQVHDAIYLEGSDPLRLGHLLKKHMEQTVTLNGRTMKFPVDLGIGKDWKNLYKISKLPSCSYQEFLSSLDFSPLAATSAPIVVSA
jgi:DNA polymerase-1